MTSPQARSLFLRVLWQRLDAIHSSLSITTVVPQKSAVSLQVDCVFFPWYGLDVLEGGFQLWCGAGFVYSRVSKPLFAETVDLFLWRAVLRACGSLSTNWRKAPAHFGEIVARISPHLKRESGFDNVLVLPFNLADRTFLLPQLTALPTSATHPASTFQPRIEENLSTSSVCCADYIPLLAFVWGAPQLILDPLNLLSGTPWCSGVSPTRSSRRWSPKLRTSEGLHDFVYLPPRP